MDEGTVFQPWRLNNEIKIETGTVCSFYTHTHLYHEMLLYTPFDGYITVNGTQTEIHTPTVVLVTARSFHSTAVRGGPPAPYLKLSFTDGMVSRQFSAELRAPVLLREYSANPFFSLLEERLRSDPPAGRREILLNAFLSELFLWGAPLPPGAGTALNPLVLEAADLLAERFWENITLSEAARRLNVTPQYLSRLFTEQLEVSFTQYLSDLRLRYAAGLLRENAGSVTEICYAAGYRNLSHFIRSFRGKYGVSPREFKNGGK